MIEPLPGARPAVAVRPTVLIEEARPIDALRRGAVPVRVTLVHRRGVVAVRGDRCGIRAPRHVVVPVRSRDGHRGERQPDCRSRQHRGAREPGGDQPRGKGQRGLSAALHSRSFAADFITSQNLIPVLFADDWDATKGAWKDPDPKQQPDIRKAVEYFGEKVRTISEDSRTGTVTIGVQWKDAALAASWANTLSTQINARLRERALEESERNVKYLQEQIASANVVALQQSIGRVLESEMQKLMIARGREEYAFKIVDRAVPARKRFRPQRALTVALCLIAGAMASIGFLLLRRSWNGGMERGPR